MILISLVLLLSIAVFIVAFFSPRWGTKAQKRSMQLLDAFLARVRGLPRFVRLIVTKPPIASHKVVHKSAELGKKASKKMADKQ